MRAIQRGLRWRLRAGHLVALALVLASVVAVPASAAAGPATVDTDYPLVLDVDLTPNQACAQPVRARVSVYHPEGAKSRAQVEWRMRFNGATVCTGTGTGTGTVDDAGGRTLHEADVPVVVTA